MAKVLCRVILLAAMIPFVLAVQGSADCDTVTGLWKFDLGGGYMASAEYKSDGSFVQTMQGMTINGTYTVKGGKLTTDVSGTKTVFSILSCTGNSMTLKRDRDGRTMIFNK
ncbi:MAG: lipocalin family protein [Spirochaetes bacterium]|nr:lipocalin family protein [Spirochaetota bacterium]